MARGLEPLQRWRPSARARKVLIGIAAALVLYSIAGFFVLPFVVKDRLAAGLSDLLARKVTIGKVAFNPFFLRARVEEAAVADKEGREPFAAFDALTIDVELASLFQKALIVREIRLEGGRLHVVRREDKSYNFSDLLERLGRGEKREGEPFRYSLNNLQVRRGRIVFVDGPVGVRHEVADIAMDLPFLSNVPYYVNTYVQPAFSASVNGTPVALRGNTKPFSESLETAIDVNISKVDIPYYWDYVPDIFKFKITSGELMLKGVLSFIQHKERPPAVAYVGTIAIGKLAVVEGKGQPLLSAALLEAELADSNLIGRRVNFGRVLVRSPDLTVRRGPGGRLNLEELVAAGRPPDGEGKARRRGAGGATEEDEVEEPAVAVTAKEAAVEGGVVRFEDLSLEKPFRTALADLAFTLKDFSTAYSHRSAATLSFRTEAAETLKAELAFSVTPRAAEGTLSLSGLKAGKYAPYYRGKVLFDVQGGTAELATRFRFAARERTTELVLEGLAASVASLTLKKRDEAAPFFTMPALSLAEGSLDLERREIVLGRLETRGGALAVRRAKGGTWNLATLAPPGPGAAGAGAAGASPGPGAPWRVRIGRLEIGRYGVKVEDAEPEDPVAMSVDRIAFRGRNLSTSRKDAGSVALAARLGAGGALAARGTVRGAGEAADLSVTLKGAEIAPWQPYFTHRVRVFVTGGAVSASGSLSLSRTEEGGARASFRGEASVDRFSSVDKERSEDFLKWGSLAVNGIGAAYNPTHVAVDGIALTDFYSRIVIGPDGTANLQGIFGGERRKEEGEPSPERAAAPGDQPGAARTGAAGAGGPAESAAVDNAAPAPVRVGTVTLQAGTIDFSDRYVKPAISARLRDIGGRISGLSSEEVGRADVDLRGSLGAEAPLEITGKINPLARDLFVDLTVSFKGIDLSPFSPYSGKYAGYAIEKGKLSLDLHYLIVRKKLDANNRVFLDQFTFGEKVDSPEATALPVKLAVALLKDRNGEIKLDLPVSGQIDDPRFRLGAIILRVIVNLLVKAATSPFALLGALFGGGEELAYAEFGPGSAEVDEGASKKLENLAKALRDRPGLKLEIEGHVDRERDGEGLRQRAFRRKVSAQKLKELTAAGQAAAPLDEVAVPPGEYPVYLRKAYRAEKFPKPRNIIGMMKELPVPEMEKLMLAHIRIADDDLRELAQERARNARDRILRDGAVEPERVFLVEPKSLPPEKKEKAKDSRVDFRIK